MYAFGEHDADLEIHAEAESFAALAFELAKGISEWMFGPVTSTRQDGGSERAQRLIKGEGSDAEDRLVDWLSQILSEMLTKEHRPIAFAEVQLNETTGAATALAAHVHFSRSELQDEIKAVTYHNLKVERYAHIWRGTIVCDL